MMLHSFYEREVRFFGLRFALDLRLVDLRLVDFFFAVFRPVFLLGTFAPFLRASDNPIAIACLRLVTFFPEPLFRVPLFRRFIALFTVLCAFLLYFAIT